MAAESRGRRSKQLLLLLVLITLRQGPQEVNEGEGLEGEGLGQLTHKVGDLQ